MRPINSSYTKTNSTSIPKLLFLSMIGIITSSVLTSCTADEIEVQQTNQIVKESSFRFKDSIIDPLNSTIIPPINPTIPPKPPKP